MQNYEMVNYLNIHLSTFSQIITVLCMNYKTLTKFSCHGHSQHSTIICISLKDADLHIIPSTICECKSSVKSSACTKTYTIQYIKFHVLFSIEI